MYNTITKTYETETAHIVRKAYSKRCAYNVHGHSYRWQFEIEGNINDAGMVIDFGNLKGIKEFIDHFDHTMVLWSEENPKFTNFFKENVERLIIMKKNPTAENMASLLFRFIDIYLKTEHKESQCNVIKTTVWETRTGRASATSYDDFDILTYNSIMDEI